MRLIGSIAVLFLISSAACGTPGANLGSDAAPAEEAIVGGKATTGFPAVGLLFNAIPNGNGSGGLCTASVIAPQKILTAAHCVLAISSAGAEEAQTADPANVVFYSGASINGAIDPNRVFNVTGIQVPGGNTFPFNQFLANVDSGTLNKDDIATLTLDRAVGVTPLTFSTQALPSSAVGQSVTLVGYGTTRVANGAGAGVKRVVTTPVTDMSPDFVEAGSRARGTCTGDSGGPVLLGNTIIAITQAGQTDQLGRCVGNDVFTRVDPWAAFLAQ
jgi:V8-like Glu-specific endopeptidase